MKFANDNPEVDIHTPKWVYGMAGDYKPTRLQIVLAQGFADGWYGSNDGDYTVDQFMADIDEADNCELGELNNAQLLELHLYGEASNWHDLSQNKFLFWRRVQYGLGELLPGNGEKAESYNMFSM